MDGHEDRSDDGQTSGDHSPGGHDDPGDHGHDDGSEHDGGDYGGMHAGHEEMFRRRFFVSTVLSVPVVYFSDFVQTNVGYTAPTFPGVEWIVPAVAVVVFLYGGVPFLRMAVPEVTDRAPGMMTLISMAISVAFVYSLATVASNWGEPFFWELVTLIDVMLVGHWIEMRSIRRASSVLDELAKLMPDTAERITDSGDIEEVPVSDLVEGDLVLVRPGASVPADGVVEEGESDVNEAMITGESKPVPKEPGDEVIGGTVNGDGSLRVRVDAIGEDTTLADIVRLVEEAQRSESRTQVLADRAAGWLFYVGGPNLLTHLDNEVPPSLQAFAREAGENAQTVVYLVVDGAPVAAFAMADVIREESYRVVGALHDLGIEVAMLTGDSRNVANAVADELGIDTVFAEVLPEDKDEKVQELQDQGRLVGMVGDGVNDAPALTRSDVGIAFRATE